MKNKKILIILLLFVLVVAVQISSVSAINATDKAEAKEIINKYSPKNIPLFDDIKKGEITSLNDKNYKQKPSKVIQVKVKDIYSTTGGWVKKDKKYQYKMKHYHKIRFFDVYFEIKPNNQYKYTDFELVDMQYNYYKSTYSPAKKGEWYKVSKISSNKKIESKGEVYKVKYYTGYQFISSSKIKKVTKVGEKTLVAYYKVFKMPKFKIGGYEWGYFKGNYFTYGNSILGYYINHLHESGYYNPNRFVYKISPKTKYFVGINIFYKKPSSFKLYVKA